MQITRKFEFDAGHRVLGHEGKCAHLHGHRYVAEVTVAATCLDDLSRVIDFSVIKKLVGEWIDVNWDHNMILNERDPILWASLKGQHSKKWSGVFPTRQPYIMPNEQNPTAEVMAEILYREASTLLAKEAITVTKVRLYETPNCWAEYEEPDNAAE